MNQYQRIINYIEDYGSITSMQAFEDLGITKLATRIGEMERAGMIELQHIRETGKNRFGETCSYIRYYKEEI